MKVHNIIQDFKKFVNKGNILDLAIGILIGTAFSAMLNSLVNDIFMPLISRVLDYDLTDAKITLKEAVLGKREFIENLYTSDFLRRRLFKEEEILKGLEMAKTTEPP